LPSIVQAAPGDGVIALAWNPPAFDGGTPITNYTIYRGTSSSALTLFTTVGDVTAQLDTAVTNGVRYYYQVSAVNAVGEGPRSNEVSSTPIGPPSTPRFLQASAGDGSVALTWQAPVSDGGSATTNYRIYRGLSSGVLSVLNSVAGNISSYTDASVTNGLTYYYQVAGVNGAGEGARSAEVSATPVRPDTSPPTLAITFPQNGTALSSATITVTGTASDNVAVQTVEVSADGTNWTAASGTAAWSESVTLHAGTNVIYARATDASGNRATVLITVTVAGAGSGPDPVILAIILAEIGAVGVVLALIVWRRRSAGRPPSPGSP